MKLEKALFSRYILSMKKNKILWIIEDDPIQLFIAKRMLANLHFPHHIHTINNAETALEELQYLSTSQEHQLPGIIFLDIHMPQMDGWHFLEEFDKLSLGNDVAIYLLTSSVDPQDAERAQANDFVKDYFIKPVKLEDLKKVLVQNIEC